MADIFVSYKQEDRAQASRVVIALRSAGRTVWWDEGITPHTAWDATIEREIEAAKAVVVLWTPRSITSDWVRSEAHYAKDRQKLISVILEPCSLPIAFMLLQAVDLSTSQLAPGNAQWAKLLQWLDELLDRGQSSVKPPNLSSDLALVSPAADKPVNMQSFSRGKTGRLTIGVFLMGLLVVAGVIMRQVWLSPARPDVIVDTFATSGGARVPTGFADDLRQETLSAFSTSPGEKPKPGDGTRHPGAFQMSGRADFDNDNIRVFLEISAPNVESPILRTKIEQTAKNAGNSSRFFGSVFSAIMRCILSSEDDYEKSISHKGLELWARFCSMHNLQESTSSSDLQLLRQITQESPNFSNGWSRLAEAQQEASAGFTGTERSALRRESEKSTEIALKLNSNSSIALMVKSNQILGKFGKDDGEDRFPHFRNFERWDEISKISTGKSQNECGCAIYARAQNLNDLGQILKAIRSYDSAEMNGSPSIFTETDQALDFMALGDFVNADLILEPLSTKWPVVSNDITRLRLWGALWNKNWALARKLNDSRADEIDKNFTSAAIEVVEKGNPNVRKTLIQKIRSAAVNPEALWVDGPFLLGLLGDDQGALIAEDKLLHRNGTNAMFVLWAPPLKSARHTPEFAALVQRLNLMEYWRIPGNRPDFCREESPPDLCKGLT